MVSSNACQNSQGHSSAETNLAQSALGSGGLVLLFLLPDEGFSSKAFSEARLQDGDENYDKGFSRNFVKSTDAL